MKLTLILIFLHVSLYAQKSNNIHWLQFENEDRNTKTITKSEDFKIQELTFKIQWDKKLSYSENLISYYGGIGELKIFYKNRLIQTINKIEDGVALGEIYFNFYDFNMDGHLDFSIQRECAKNCYDDFYLYNNSKKQFIHQKAWDYIRIKKINMHTKQIVTQPDDNSFDVETKIYNVVNNSLVELKTMN